MQVNDSEKVNLEDALKEAIINTLDTVRGEIEISKVKKYAQGYLVLELEKGEGGGIAIYCIEKEETIIL